MSQFPTVSFLMSVYNAERYLRQTVESILNQTYQDFEFVVINDGSTDRSLAILQNYAAQDKRIRLIHRENRGIPATRNELVAQARGELIAVMDADDIAFPDRLALQVAFLLKNPETVWVGGAFDLIDDRGRRLTRVEMPQSNDEIQALLVQGSTSFLHPGAMIRRSALLKVGGYDEALPTAHDLDLWLKLSEVGKLANLKEPVVQYRIHANSICDRNKERALNEIQIAFDRAWQRRGIQTRFQPTVVCGWRPTSSRSSRYEFMLRYGWWAFDSHERGAAMEYGLRAIGIKPFSLDSWKLFACAAIKPLPPKQTA